jgi:ribonuclease VapC
MPPVKVLDAFAVLAFFYNEPGADMVQKLMEDAGESKINLLLSVINAGEVWYRISRGNSPDVADHSLLEFQAIGVDIVEADWNLTRQAAFYKARGNISYADCFTAALAKARNCPVVTGDKEFKQLENEIKIEWLA